MRIATMSTGWLEDANTPWIGLALGADFVAEHEYGIATLQAAFAVPGVDWERGARVGLAGRTIGQVPPELRLAEYERKIPKQRRKEPAAVLCYERRYDGLERSAPELARAHGVDFVCEASDKYYEAGKHDLRCAWDARGFIVHARGAENRERLRLLAQAFRDGDLAMDVNVDGWKSRNGLTFVIPSRVPAALAEKIAADDRAHIELTQALAATGIAQRLKAAGRDWYALAPAWRERDGQRELQVFLNPVEQNRNNHGWFTIADLDAWIAGAGPIPKPAPEKVAAPRP